MEKFNTCSSESTTYLVELRVEKHLLVMIQNHKTSKFANDTLKSKSHQGRRKLQVRQKKLGEKT